MLPLSFLGNLSSRSDYEYLVETKKITWLRIVETLCMLLQSVQSHVCVRSGSYNLSISCSAEFPGVREEKFDGDLPFSTGYTKVSHSLHTVQLWVSVFIPSAAEGGFFVDYRARR